MPLSTSHPLIADWFRTHVGDPTEVQIQAWPAIQSGSDVLIAAPTGSGKTLAAFLACIDQLFEQALARESLVPPWRDLLLQYRRMEMAGDVRGGRFVSGFVGEQFALPEAVDSLRAMRKNAAGTAQEVKLSACDPLNLAGIILPGPRIPAVATNYLVFRDGAIAKVVVGRDGERNAAGLAAATG